MSLKEAAEGIRRVSVQNMLKMSSSPDPPGRHLLHEELARAGASLSLQVVTQLLEDFPDRASTPNENGNIALHVACQYASHIDSRVVLQLIEAYPTGPAIANNFGQLPLHKAGMAASTPNAATIIRCVAAAFPRALRCRQKDGSTPLHLCVSYPRETDLGAVEAMLEGKEGEGAAKLTDNKGMLPLHKACCKSNIDVDIIEAIIRAYPKGAEVQDSYGYTPLHWWMSRDLPNIEVTYSLLEANMLATLARDNTGKCPYDIHMLRDKYCRANITLLIKNEERAKAHLKEMEAEAERERQRQRQNELDDIARKKRGY